MLHEIALSVAAISHAGRTVCRSAPAPVIGTLCAPPGSGKHPAMILLGGSDCGDSMSTLAATFAAHGYVAISVQYCGADGKPPYLIDVPVETVGAALTALSHRADVEQRRIGILGESKGGEFAMLAASTYPQITAVVADVPSPYAFMGLGADDLPSGCSWSKGGKPLPCIGPDSAAGQQIGMEFETGAPVSLKPLYDASRRADPSALAAATFPLEKIHGPVLCLAGADDAMWNSPSQCADAMRYLRGHNHRFIDTAIVYPNAGHLFLAATHGPKSAIVSVKAGASTFNFGGTAQGDVAAAKSAWATIWPFLRRTLGP
jgi:dienelactone hydrolase